MKSLITTKENTKKTSAIKLAITLTALSVIGLSLPATAQGLGADQESLLPPEVVPMDPAVASQLSQSQAQSRQSGFESQPEAFQPGMTNARDSRKEAFQSLMGREDLMQQANSQPAPSQFTPMNGAQMDQYAPGQLLPQAQQQMGQQFNQQQQPSMPHASDWQTPGQNGQNSFPAQGQTLAGNIKRNPVKGIARTGLSHTLTSLAAFGAGAYTMTMMRSPAALYSTGIMGVGLGNYALRSGFRF